MSGGGAAAIAPAQDADLLQLAATLVAIPSVSRDEATLADWIETRLRARCPALSVDRLGNSVVARSDGRAGTRVILSGHLDTVPGVAGAHLGDRQVGGLGAVDMKGGLAVMLRLAEEQAGCRYASTFIFYDGEELGSERSGLTRLMAERRELVAGDFAVVLEPTDNWLEAGCQGVAVFEAVFRGQRAHSARPWLGVNAVTRALPALNRLASYPAATAEVEGLAYRESLQVVSLEAGIASNVLPDKCTIQVNRRYAPSRTLEEVSAEVACLAEGADSIRVVRSSPAGRPWLDHPLVASFRRGLGLRVRPKMGTTDVGRFSRVGIPAVNFGPGSPEMAHTSHEVVTAAALEECYQALTCFLNDVGH